jgi:hypothetical protein
VRGELVPGPGRFEIEVLDADPRRVKKLKIYLHWERLNGQGHETPRPASATTSRPSAQTDLPVAPDASVKLAPDAPPPKPARRP